MKLWTEEEGFGEHHPLDEADIRHFRRGCETAPPLPAVALCLLTGGLSCCRADYAAISFTDAQIGRVIDALEATGPSIADNTITCLWSDHGWHLGDTNSYTKLTNFETVRRTRRLVPALRLRKSFDCVPEPKSRRLSLAPVTCSVQSFGSG